MLKPDDKVWVQVTRDKERPATIITEVPTDLKCRVYQVYFDHGETAEFEEHSLRLITGDVAKKNDQEKNRMELIPVSGIEGIGRAMTFGAKKYSAHNWANGFEWLRLCGSALRHLTAWMSGQDKDPESGLSHLDHLGACVVMLIAHETEGLGTDNRRKRKLK